MIVSSTSSEYATDDSAKARMRQTRMTTPLTRYTTVAHSGLVDVPGPVKPNA